MHGHVRACLPFHWASIRCSDSCHSDGSVWVRIALCVQEYVVAPGGHTIPSCIQSRLEVRKAVESKALACAATRHLNDIVTNIIEAEAVEQVEQDDGGEDAAEQQAADWSAPSCGSCKQIWPCIALLSGSRSFSEKDWLGGWAHGSSGGRLASPPWSEWASFKSSNVQHSPRWSLENTDFCFWNRSLWMKQTVHKREDWWRESASKIGAVWRQGATLLVICNPSTYWLVSSHPLQSLLWQELFRHFYICFLILFASAFEMGFRWDVCLLFFAMIVFSSYMYNCPMSLCFWGFCVDDMSEFDMVSSTSFLNMVFCYSLVAVAIAITICGVLGQFFCVNGCSCFDIYIYIYMCFVCLFFALMISCLFYLACMALEG